MPQLLQLKQFEQLDLGAMIKYLQSNAPKILEFLKPGMKLDQLSSKDLTSMFKLALQQESIVEIAETVVGKLPKDAERGLDEFSKRLEKIPEEQREALIEIFKDTVMSSMKSGAEDLYKSMKKHNPYILFFEGALVSCATNLLSGILKFRQAVDAKFPKLIDIALNAASFAIIAVVTAHYPIAGIALAASGILEIAKGYLSCEKLEKSIESLHKKQAEIKNDLQLHFMYEQGEQVAATSEKFNIDPQILQELNLGKDTLDKLASAAGQKASQALITEVAVIAKATPLTEQEMKEKLQELKKEVTEIVGKNFTGEENKSVKEVINKFLDKKFTELEKKALEGFKDKTFFEKVSAYQKIASELGKLPKELSDLPEFKAKEAKNAPMVLIERDLKQLEQERIIKPVTKLVATASSARELSEIIGLTAQHAKSISTAARPRAYSM